MIPTPFFALIDVVLQLYSVVVFVAVIMTWLLTFNVINRHNQFVGMIWGFVSDLTEPALRRIRRIVPTIGNIDISPIVLLLAIFFLRSMNQWLKVRIGI